MWETAREIIVNEGPVVGTLSVMLLAVFSAFILSMRNRVKDRQAEIERLREDNKALRDRFERLLDDRLPETKDENT